jgi:small subunit ribosomal protein S9
MKSLTIHGLDTPSLPAHTRTLATASNAPKPKTRIHAINILDGDYSEYDDDDYEYEDAFPEDEDDQFAVGRYHPKGTDANSDIPLEQQALKLQQERDARKARWIENAKPKVRKVEIDERGRSYGRGGRKTSTARVWIRPGEGVISINRRDFLEFFPRESHRELILSPMIATGTCGKFDMVVSVEGGGVTGKAGAIRHGLARALEKYNPDYRPPMKRLGFMTRDNRQVERKKVGLKKARKAPQWVRR